MASMRRLKRRLTVWQRYADRYNHPGDYLLAWRPFKPARGHTRAVIRLTDEQVRRDWFQFRPDDDDWFDVRSEEDEW
ncbi:MAG: hypothetical protein QOE61_3056 [Micromonosporaceae bacterium]|jgi:hypothetical protein|uniref:hypothetical protein n=1 Tax=Mycobacterium sp. TaxID=1785 RepID=UPI0028B35C08|nr:hypothetical protein [Mycobacterium sp.]MDT5026630.1 hypothetical protein [Micromonosporaceae bacterium]MDT5119269.1 hypothetical protein [Mycobacterium sp.]